MTDATGTAPVAHETPLASRHAALGARMIDFAGWLMPVQYTSILEEHRAVRERVGLFDLSHMGELFIEGPEAAEALAGAVVSDPPAAAERSASPCRRVIERRRLRASFVTMRRSHGRNGEPARKRGRAS